MGWSRARFEAVWLLADLFVEAAPGAALIAGLAALAALVLLILGFFCVVRE